jgi:hypothetical protein
MDAYTLQQQAQEQQQDNGTADNGSSSSAQDGKDTGAAAGAAGGAGKAAAEAAGLPNQVAEEQGPASQVSTARRETTVYHVLHFCVAHSKYEVSWAAGLGPLPSWHVDCELSCSCIELSC